MQLPQKYFEEYRIFRIKVSGRFTRLSEDSTLAEESTLKSEILHNINVSKWHVHYNIDICQTSIFFLGEIFFIAVSRPFDNCGQLRARQISPGGVDSARASQSYMNLLQSLGGGVCCEVIVYSNDAFSQLVSTSLLGNIFMKSWNMMYVLFAQYL